MDLKIKDVAVMLRVSQTTVRRWLKEGKIPAYQLNRQYRFNRSEIEDWMVTCKLHLRPDSPSLFEEKQIYPSSEQEGGTHQFALYRAMHKGGVLSGLGAKNKQELIGAVMQKSAARLGLDAEVATELLLDREALMSTALNSGIAVPHPREIVLKLPTSDTIVTVFPSRPIEFEALDGKAVHTLFFLFSSSDKMHLHLLSKLAHLTSGASNLEFLASKPNQDTLLAFVKEWETKLRHQIYTTDTQ
jgi:PTS system nitrogen regulatory IIA component